jgi:hypothetical protein
VLDNMDKTIKLLKEIKILIIKTDIREKMVMSEGASVTTAMVAVKFLEVGGDTLMKSATKDGMSIYIFVFYSNLFSLFFLLPTTLFYHRKRAPPPISISILFRIFLLSCFRYISTNYNHQFNIILL